MGEFGWADILKALITGLVAAGGAFLATQFLEPRRLKLARKTKLAELRFEAHRKLVAAFTRLDIDREDYVDRLLIQANIERAQERMHESLRLALLQFAESRYLLDDSQLKAAREFFREFDRVLWSPIGGAEQDLPSCGQLIREQFDAEHSMDLSSVRPRPVRQVSATVERAALPPPKRE